MKKYSFVLLLLIIAVNMEAQEMPTGESISKQYRNNSVRGLKYGPATSSTPPQVKPHMTMAEEIRRGKFGRIQSGSGSSPAAPDNPKAEDNGKLPSSSSASEAEQKQQAKASKAQVQQAVPLQQEKNAVPAETKTALPGGPIKAPVKKVQQ